MQITGPSTASADPWPCQELHTPGLSLRAVLESHLPGEQTQEAQGLMPGWRMGECGPEINVPDQNLSSTPGCPPKSCWRPVRGRGEVSRHRQSGWPCAGHFECPISMRGTAHSEPMGFGFDWSAGMGPWGAALALPLASELGEDRGQGLSMSRSLSPGRAGLRGVLGMKERR